MPSSLNFALPESAESRISIASLAHAWLPLSFCFFFFFLLSLVPPPGSLRVPVLNLNLVGRTRPAALQLNAAAAPLSCGVRDIMEPYLRVALLVLRSCCMGSSHDDEYGGGGCGGGAEDLLHINCDVHTYICGRQFSELFHAHASFGLMRSAQSAALPGPAA